LLRLHSIPRIVGFLYKYSQRVKSLAVFISADDQQDSVSEYLTIYIAPPEIADLDDPRNHLWIQHNSEINRTKYKICI
jgi:hypothetical protein